MHVRLLLVAFLALSIVGCKPKPGAKCKTDGKEACKDKSTALVCRDGTWQEMACRGKDGCEASGSEVSCDQSFGQDGDLCTDDGKAVCTKDAKAALECKKGKWSLNDKCLGPKGCATDALFVRCDNSQANLGDPCSQDDDHACALDAKSMLKCKGSKWELVSFCRGAKACRVSGDDVSCDQSLADVGDACEGESAACSSDLKAVLACKGGKMTIDEKCKKGCEAKSTGDHTGTIGCK